MDEHRPDEIYIQYPDGRVSVAVRKTKDGMRIKTVVNYDNHTYKHSCKSVEDLESWILDVRCDGCAYRRQLYNSGATKACHYLLDNGTRRERDAEDTCFSKSDIRRVRFWDLNDLCRPIEGMD